MLIKIDNILQVGSKYLLNNMGDINSYFYKESSRDYALKQDIELEKLYTNLIRKEFPKIPILGEELTAKDISSSYRGKFFTIDPIDGTINYSRSIPEFGTVISLVENNSSILSGMSFPAFNEVYLAAKEEGAFKNGEKISVSNNFELNKVIVGYGDFAVGKDNVKKNLLRKTLISKLADQVLRIRMPGSAALQLAWLASGKIDISLTLGNNAWDVQAGVLLVREAGGVVFDYDNTEHSTKSTYTLASNERLRLYVMNLINECINN